jgi:phosphohistidine phosphatase SixA
MYFLFKFILMKHEYSDSKVREMLWGKLNVLMDEAYQHIYKKDDEAKKNYSFSAHNFIDKNNYELLFPLEKEKWPEKFLGMIDKYDRQMTWPNWTMYNYMMDVVCPPFIPISLIHFGYAVYENELRPVTFFVMQVMVDYQEWPQGMVIDPLAVRDGKEPDFYIGVPVDKEDIQDWVKYRKTSHPLEYHVTRKNEIEHRERIRRSYMESYYLQMAYEPNWFSHQLLKFAEEEGLYIPSPQSNERYVSKRSVVKEVKTKVQSSLDQKEIIVVRHADYERSDSNDKDPHLSNYGKSQAKKLGEKIKERVGDANVVIWFSSANRAKETADILKEILSPIVYIEEEKLWSDNWHKYDFDWLEDKIRKFTGMKLVIISHLEYVNDFPLKLGFQKQDVGYTQGVIFSGDKCTLLL